jgi:NADH-quinone oxidoreductase subunit A
MTASNGATSLLWPLVIYFAAIVAIIGAILITSFVVGERRTAHSNIPYESGMNPTGSTNLRLSVSYYLIAMFFLIFDLASAFVFAWAISLHEAGWTGYGAILLFIFILSAGFAYLWREGSLEVRTSDKQ